MRVNAPVRVSCREYRAVCSSVGDDKAGCFDCFRLHKESCFRLLSTMGLVDTVIQLILSGCLRTHKKFVDEATMDQELISINSFGCPLEPFFKKVKKTTMTFWT
ncbi:uncharacterized protein LOC111268913 [Varroa jacobsoni]|uniref:uncharacterized protein LOC111268913 n=1 Tax=Varroa jacobsoni TaxID=62625 RepID=UPI000BFA055E|nr:uncharacterized protein LOC111268913 [Varroa jacobsoni]